MGAPKRGDRIRVTFVGTVHADFSDYAMYGDGYSFHLPDAEYVKVLPKPVYVNSDTTEYRHGDVVRSAVNKIYIYSSVRAHGWMDSDGIRLEDNDLAMPLTLLVRDGQVVA
jgi:hypothetical protein